MMSRGWITGCIGIALPLASRGLAQDGVIQPA
jgi:hypothetical protein